MDITKEAAGIRVGQLRTVKGWSMRELARRAGLSVSDISNFEKGIEDSPRPLTLSALAAALGWADWDTMMSTDALEPPPVQPAPISGELRATILEVLREEAASFRQGLDHQEAAMTSPEGRPVLASTSMRPVTGTGTIAAGAGHSGHGGPDDDLYMHPDEIGGRQLYWARVRGECMAPRVQGGDVLIYERVDERDIKDRDYLVLILLDEGAEGSHAVKRVRWIGEQKAILEAKDGSETKVDMRRVRIIGRYVEHRATDI
ncbi:MAG TPA: helix-turn-helix domain-containing protein [Chloroflexota bacterium]|nr:helix-turn-helix domain-containing protein [Chloroflexota bacterium]